MVDVTPRPVPSYDWTAYHADLAPDRIALVDDGRDVTFTYRDLEDQVRRLAVWLVDHDVGRGDRVAFLAGNTTDIFEALFACAKVGAILVPLNWRLAPPELAFIVDDSQPKVIIYESEYETTVATLNVEHGLRLGEGYEAAKAATDPTQAPTVTATHDDPWAILYTSGTTGHPKGAIETHGMFFWNAINIGSAVGVRHEALAVRQHSKCGRPKDVYGFQQIDHSAVVGAVKKVLAET